MLMISLEGGGGETFEQSCDDLTEFKKGGGGGGGSFPKIWGGGGGDGMWFAAVNFAGSFSWDPGSGREELDVCIVNTGSFLASIKPAENWR